MTLRLMGKSEIFVKFEHENVLGSEVNGFDDRFPRGVRIRRPSGIEGVRQDR